MKASWIASVCVALLLALTSEVWGQSRLGAAIEELATHIGASVAKEQKRKIGVIPFSGIRNEGTVFGSYLSEELTSHLFNTQKFDLVEKALMNKVLRELKLGETGVIDPATVKRVGQIAGVDAIVTGTVTDLGPYVAVNCRLIDIQTGTVLGAASVRIVKDDEVTALWSQSTRMEKGTQGGTGEETQTGRERLELKRTIYFGGDWLTVILDSLEIIEGRFVRVDLTFVNPFEAEVGVQLDEPRKNTYIVDNLGNSYNFVSSLGMAGRGERHLRPGERASISVILEAHRKPATHITLRTRWYASGQGFHGPKELVVRSIRFGGL